VTSNGQGQFLNMRLVGWGNWVGKRFEQANSSTFFECDQDPQREVITIIGAKPSRPSLALEFADSLTIAANVWAVSCGATTAKRH